MKNRLFLFLIPVIVLNITAMEPSPCRLSALEQIPVSKLTFEELSYLSGFGLMQKNKEWFRHICSDRTYWESRIPDNLPPVERHKLIDRELSLLNARLSRPIADFERKLAEAIIRKQIEAAERNAHRNSPFFSSPPSWREAKQLRENQSLQYLCIAVLQVEPEEKSRLAGILACFETLCREKGLKLRIIPVEREPDFPISECIRITYPAAPSSLPDRLKRYGEVITPLVRSLGKKPFIILTPGHLHTFKVHLRTAPASASAPRPVPAHRN